MRHSLLLIPLALGTLAPPIAAQISATIHIGTPRHAPPVIIHREPPRIVVVNYPSRNYGRWQQTAQYWRPVTLYVHGNRYYPEPWRDARPITVYQYRDSYFLPPHDRDWDRYRWRYARNDWQNGRWDRDNDRYDRYDRDDWDDRWDGRANSRLVVVDQNRGGAGRND